MSTTGTLVCPQCGGTDIERDAARGDAVCTGCGSVLEDNIIVSELTFQEQSSGALTLVGQFVPSDSGGSVSRGGPLVRFKFTPAIGRDSREITLQQAKRRLSHLGSKLKLNQHCIDMAFGFFKMALQLNLTRGRKSCIMDTACLYLVCRSEGTPHMLLDFSDVLKINVYSLGRAYLKLSTALHINPPALDPCLYIHRFAHKLELGDKVHDVSMTALRLVARMKRDWIHHGRRPAGLCGAALLVAARLHNFSRSVRQVSRVVKLSEGTVRKRLSDFENTPSSCLTIDEFLKIDLELENDPPCYLEAKKKGKEDRQGSEKTIGNEEGEEEDREERETVNESTNGFSGIQLQSVQDIIAKARMTESFLTVPTAGLSDDLNELVDLVNNDTTTINDDNKEEGGEGEGECEDDVQGEGEDKGGELDLDGINDAEIESMLLSEEEVRIKSQLWFAENGDFLKELEARKEKLAMLEAEKATKPKRKIVRKRMCKKDHTPAASAGEAIERMLVEKKLSTKINYEVLRKLEQEEKQREEEEERVRDMGSTAHSILNSSKLDFSSRLSGLQPSTSSFTSGSTSSLTINTSFSRSGSNRLPSLTNRKRSLLSSSLSGVGGGEGNKYQRTSSSESTSTDSINNRTTTTVAPTLNNDEVIEDTGPIHHLEEEEGEEGEGFDDKDLDDLMYDGDPLAVASDYEDDDDINDEDFFN